MNLYKEKIPERAKRLRDRFFPFSVTFDLSWNVKDEGRVMLDMVTEARYEENRAEGCPAA